LAVLRTPSSSRTALAASAARTGSVNVGGEDGGSE
jgi:hypothetical protein